MTSDARTLSPDAQAVLRQRAVAAVLGGMKQTEAAKLFDVSRQAIRNWLDDYEAGGEAALQPRKRGPKTPAAKLTQKQAELVRNLIIDRHPEQLKMPFVLWTSDAVRLLIERTFGVKVSARSVRRYLAQWGFTPQKPKRIAYEKNDAAVQRWLSEQYPAIRAQARRERAQIYWGDEMGVRSDHQAGRSYAPKGQTPTRMGTGKRFGANVLSALTNRGHLAFMVFKQRFTAPVFLRFLRRLVKQAFRKLHLIVDSHPVHRSKRVARWLAEHADHIQMHFLPGYSPELNPDEMLNHDVKANAVGRKRPRSQPELLRNLRTFINRRRDDPDQVKRYFHEESVKYAAA